MSSAGHIQDMNNRMRQNRAALSSKKAKLKERKLFNIKYKGSGVIIDDIDLSKEELIQLKNEIREELRAERIRKWVKVVLIVLLVFVLLVSVVSYYLF